MQPEKKKMQSVSFRNLGELLDYLPEDQVEIVERLRELIFECLPDVQERLSFNVPFFKKYQNLLYIWPGAVAWGSKTYPGVELGFIQGHLLTDEIGFLEKGKRKQICTRRFFHAADLPHDLLRAYIFEAAEVDEMLFMEKRRRKKQR